MTLDVVYLQKALNETQSAFTKKKEENDEMREALKNIVYVLGAGPCSEIKCEGCSHEFAEAAEIAGKTLQWLSKR